MKSSCLLSCYTKENPIFLDKSLESIENQYHKTDEVVIVEDGILTDEIYAILDKYDKILPLKRIRLEKNVGLAKALNIGLNECSYEIVFRMDTDDICNPTRFKKQLEVFEKDENLHIIGSWSNDIDSNDKLIRVRKVPIENKDIKKYIWTNPMLHPSVAYKKSIIQKIGAYDPKLRKRQDHDLWFRAVKNNLNFYNIPEPLINYRFTDQFYEKNTVGVTFSHAVLGLKGLLSIKSISLMGYIGVFSPLVRSLLPNFMAKYFHRLMDVFDPRKKV